MILERFCYGPHGVFSTYMLDGIGYHTVERPWLDNKPSISCIPVGNYECVPRYYHRGGYDAIEVTDVPGRTHILWHAGNTMMNTKGCILPGCDLGFIDKMWAVTGSRVAFNELMDWMEGEPFSLEIKNTNQNDAGILIRRGQRLE